MFLIHDFIFFIYSLVYLPYALLTGRVYKSFGQRLGFLPDSFKESQSPTIWVHAVSVGEVMLASNFIPQLKDRYPKHHIIFSVTTKTGFALAQEKLSSMAQVIASPLDFSVITRKFIRIINPQIYIALETEIWPNLFSQLHARRIPVVIINGRISDQSFPRYQLIKVLLKNSLAKIDLFCAQSIIDGQRMVTLGLNPSKVTVTGNLKFDDVVSVKQAGNPYFANNDQLWWVAGSTHPGEEEILLDTFKQLKGQFRNWRLVLAPRHIERSTSVMSLVTQAGFNAVALSQSKGALGIDDVMVVDSLGQLRALYALSSLVFVGKSLTVGGGHNIIEPAVVAKPIIIGPLMANFRDITVCFKKADAIIQVQDTTSLKTAVEELMMHDVKRRELGSRARKVVDENQGASLRTLKAIAQVLE